MWAQMQLPCTKGRSITLEFAAHCHYIKGLPRVMQPISVFVGEHGMSLVCSFDCFVQVVGHTIQEQGINSACAERVFRIDVGMSKGCGNGEPEVQCAVCLCMLNTPAVVIMPYSLPASLPDLTPKPRFAF